MTDREKYERKCQKLKEECLKRRQEIINKYADKEKLRYGLDGDPEEKELYEVHKLFSTRLKKLQKKYHIND